jgi:hypothetical protein
MGGNCRKRCFGAFQVLLASAAAVGLPGDGAAAPERVLVQVMNSASVSPQMLTQAQHSVTTIYHDIGVDVVWTGSAPASPTDRAVLIEIVSTALPDVSAKAMGVALRDPLTLSAQVAYVFYDRIKDIGLRSHYPVTPQILGAVIAHELGHLLLPYGSHSPTGLMRAEWNEYELQGLNFSRMRFTSLQGDLIRQRLACGDRACAAPSASMSQALEWLGR